MSRADHRLAQYAERRRDREHVDNVNILDHPADQQIRRIHGRTSHRDTDRRIRAQLISAGLIMPEGDKS
jgi:hypothetical protein